MHYLYLLLLSSVALVWCTYEMWVSPDPGWRAAWTWLAGLNALSTTLNGYAIANGALA